MSDDGALRAALQRKKSLIDFRLGDIADANATSVWTRSTPRNSDGLVEGCAKSEKATTAELASRQRQQLRRWPMACPTLCKPSGTPRTRAALRQLPSP